MPGFEPGIMGPKPIALPLGYIPLQLNYIQHIMLCKTEMTALTYQKT